LLNQGHNSVMRRKTYVKGKLRCNYTDKVTVSETILLVFNKPFNTLCQFTGEESDNTLADYIRVKGVYPAGRLDKDSEGLLLLTNDGKLQNRISHPKHKMEKSYWVQVEGQITDEALRQLSTGVELNDGKTRPAKTRLISIDEGFAELWPREPPVRFRKNVPTSWFELTIKEGKNRQVRRMTASVGFPTLRLIRMSIGNWTVKGLEPGNYTQVKL